MVEPAKMTSNRPYLLRALYEWINDNQLTPYILVDAKMPGVQVPASTIKDGKVVLNIAMRAVEALDLGDASLSFKARFSGVSQFLVVPVPAVIAIYAQETGQGMMLPPDEVAETELNAEGEESDIALDVSADDEDTDPPKPSGPGKSPFLRIVK
jgi:stringent starvation protein B